MKKILSLCFSTLVLASPLVASAQDVQEDEMLLAMYFDMDQRLDQKIEVATRAPKSLRQIAENVTVITTEEIERMNANTVGEVLNRVPGVYVQFSSHDFNGLSFLHIHDSDREYVLVLLDGIIWNTPHDGGALVDVIPVEIIDRIEVIKGPASSTWGSAPGGVINIITKRTGSELVPSGTLSASYGEGNSSRLSATFDGKAGLASYFISAASQDSDGLLNNRFYDSESVYGKARIELPSNTTLTATAGYSEPEMNFGDTSWYSGWGDPSDYRYTHVDRNFWATLSLDTALSQNMNLHMSGYRKEQKYLYDIYSLPSKSLLSHYYGEAWSSGFNTILNTKVGKHLISAGGDYERNKRDLSWSTQRKYDENWAIFINDTYSLGAISITPGLRYDNLSLTENQLSPSLGITWQAADHTLLRGLVARGFKRPYMDENAPNLDPELVTSYQLGLETTFFPSVSIKTTLFEHKLKDTWQYDYVLLYSTNQGKEKRYGYEVEFQTKQWNSLALNANFTYVYTDYYELQNNDDMYYGKITLEYNNPKILTAELFGQYIWSNNDRVSTDPEYGTMIWDLSLNKDLTISEQFEATLFFTAHNLFNGKQYWDYRYENAPRWVEGGVRFHF